ncbi:MAG TPA: glycosyltransferase [Planctomycetota bacterium]|nr:glycosyltransferase [Planctomycetota bacterium]
MLSGTLTTHPLRILMISPRFAPMADPEAFCGAKMALALMDEGVDLQVLYDQRYLETERVSRDSSDMWKRLESVSIVPEKPSPRLLDGLRSAVRYVAYSRWAHVALRAARRLHAEKPFDLIYSRSLPMQAHVVGYWCARELHLPWVANINDPWDIRFSPVKGEDAPSLVRAALSGYWLRKTLRSTHLVTFPCERLARHTSRHVKPKRPYRVIPHVGLSANETPDPHIFRLVHAGLLLGKRYGRSAEGLLRGLRRFVEDDPEARSVTRLTFIGPHVAESSELAIAFGVGENVDTTGRVSYVDSLVWIAKADVCVLIEADIQEGIYLPSKLVDYLTAGKPVLALSPPLGTVADIAGEARILRVNADDARGVAAALKMLYDDFRNGTLDRRRPAEELVRRFDAKHIAREFLSALQAAGIRPR